MSGVCSILTAQPQTLQALTRMGCNYSANKHRCNTVNRLIPENEKKCICKALDKAALGN